MNKTTCLLTGLLYFVGFVAFALEPQGPLALSMSGSGRGIPKGAEYHLLNPASLIHFKGVQGAGFYMFKVDKQKPYWGVSLVENQKIPLGLSYIREWDSSNQYLSFSTAGFVLPNWSVGVSLSRWKKNENAHWNVQGGLLIWPEKSPFSIGAVYDYILPLKGAFEGRRKWSLGLAYTLYQWLSLRTDILYNREQKWTLAGGAEATLSSFLVLRLSSRWHDKKWLFAGGLGVTAKNMALDYGLSQQKNLGKWQNTLNVRFAF